MEIDNSTLTRWCYAHAVQLHALNCDHVYVMFYTSFGKLVCTSYELKLSATELNSRDVRDYDSDTLRLHVDVFLDRIRRWASENQVNP